MSTTTYRPNAAGSNTDISYQYPASTEHYDKVDEDTPDDNTTRIYTSTTSYQVDTYGFADPSETGIIDSIAVHFRARTVSAGTSYAKAAIYVGSTLYYGDEEAITNTWADKSKTWTEKPGGGAWAWGDLNSLEFGVALKYAAGGSVDCTQVYLVITYHAPLGGSYAAVIGL